MGDKIILRRGLKDDLPELDEGEAGYSLDTQQLYIGGAGGNDLILTKHNRVYEVGPELEYQSIQDAIDAAVADGFTTRTNAALVKIYEKGSPYIEDLTFYPGVMLAGEGRARTDAVSVNGNHTYSVSNANSQFDNSLQFERVSFNGVAGSDPTFTFAGTGNAVVRFADCAFNRSGLNDSVPVFRFTNTNGGSQARFIDTVIVYSDTSGTGIALDLQRGATRLYGGNAFMFGMGNETLVRVQNAAQFQIFGGTGGNLAVIGNVTSVPVFQIDGASAAVTLQHCQLNIGGSGGSGADLFNFTAAGQVRIRHCEVFIPGGAFTKFASGSSGSLISSYVSFAGTFANGALIGLSRTDPGITLNFDAEGLRIERSNGEIRAKFGQSGFPTLQSAIDFLDEYSFGGTKKVIIAPGNYTENVSLPTSTRIYLEGLQYSHEGLGIPTINGNIDFFPEEENQGFVLKNLRVVGVENTPCLTISGSESVFANIINCIFDKSDVDGEPTVEYSNTSSGNIVFTGCELNRGGDDDSHCIGLSNTSTGKNIEFHDCSFNVSGADWNSPALTRVLNAEAGDYVNIKNCDINVSSNSVFELGAASNLVLSNSYIGQNMNHGQLIKYTENSGATGSNIVFCNLQFFGQTAGFSVARNGVQASGNFELTSNTWNTNDQVIVNGVAFEYDVDFTTGVDENETAQNIASAINASNNGSIENVVYAVAVDNFVNIYSYSGEAAANSYGLSTSGTPPVTASGATLSGGADGHAGDFVMFGQIVINQTKSTDKITYNEYDSAIVSI